MHYRAFTKGDARRYFVVLLAIDEMPQGEATMHRVSESVGCTRAEATRAVQIAEKQFGVTVDRNGPVYSILSWGVLKKNEVKALAKAGQDSASRLVGIAGLGGAGRKGSAGAAGGPLAD